MSLTLYTLAQVREGTGWPEGSRFLLVLGNPEAAIAAVSCGWTESEEGVWTSACGGEWPCVPDDRYFRHCPGCGKAIASTAYVEPPACFLCGEGADHGVYPGEEGRPLLARQEVDGRYLFHEDCADDAEPADTGGGCELVDDGDEPEF